MGLFDTLHIGNSGLKASQVAVATTGHNIANANDASYTRQRVVFSASTAISTGGINIGTGVSVNSIVRIHDEFAYAKMRNTATDLQYDSFSKQVLQEASQYFPDLDKKGIANDIKNYFSAWNNLASNSSESAQKINLIQNASTMTQDIQTTRNSLRKLQDSLNDQLKSNIDEVNSIGQQLADLNKQINASEATTGSYANDLRDKRDKLELSLGKLVGISVYKGDMTSNSSADASMTDEGTEYYLNIAGMSFVNGSTFHPLSVDNSANQSSYYSVYMTSQDGSRYNLTEKMHGGTIGSLLDLRGRVVDSKVNGSYPQDGTIQGYIDSLDTLAQTMITETNNIYAQSAQKRMDSTNLDISNDISLQNAYNNIQNGSFDVVVYDTAGKEIARKNISIDSTTSMGDDTFSSSILTQFNSNSDDNKDNNSLNDVDDYFKATYMQGGKLSIEPKNLTGGFTVSIVDHGTNFPGAIGVSQFLTGTNASDIQVATKYVSDPSSMQAFGAPVSGNNDMANNMVKLQYNTLNFYARNGSVDQDTIASYYNSLTTKLGSDATASSTSYDTNEALYNTVESQYQSISGVNTDEELSNLIVYQSSYSANAKVITTIDKMLDTLLGIKS